MKTDIKYVLKVKKTFIEENTDILKQKDIIRILERNKKIWKDHLPVKTSDFLKFIQQNKIVTKISLDFPHRKEIRYLMNVTSIYRLLLSLSSGSYFSHLTAAYCNSLIKKEPRDIIINTEQTRKIFNDNNLQQYNIDMAFKNQERITKNIINIFEKTVYHINGKNTNCLGVVKKINKNIGEELRYTDIERTLIDSAVRPQYTGGVNNVLNIFQNAISKLDVNKIIMYLKKINFTYPYHQVIGFYLQKAGFAENKLKGLKEMGINFNFYLCNQIINPSYSDKWKLYYPNLFDNQP